MQDYLIVGFGLAGLSFASVLERNNHSFHVIDLHQDHHHRVIGGMYNPIILKRFSPAWKAHEMWQKSVSTYSFFENKFHKTYNHPFYIHRILHNIEEQNNWVVASDKEVMKEYMMPDIIPNTNSGIFAPYGLGVLHNVGRIDGEGILQCYTRELLAKNKLSQDYFLYDSLIQEDGFVSYQGKQYKHVVFCEGVAINENPFFHYLPMKVSKGEMLLIKVPGLQLEVTLKSGVFMVPVAHETYLVGATYHWEDTSLALTDKGSQDLQNKLRSFLKLPYQILDFKVGVRPTVSDRRPLIGQHPLFRSLYVLNGLGTRGIILAPALADILYQKIENNKEIEQEMNIDRFKSSYTI